MAKLLVEIKEAVEGARASGRAALTEQEQAEFCVMLLVESRNWACPLWPPVVAIP